MICCAVGEPEKVSESLCVLSHEGLGEGRKEGREEGREGRREGGRKGGRKSYLLCVVILCVVRY